MVKDSQQAPAIPRARTQNDHGSSSLVTDKGTTTINNDVVSKIAGLSAREVDGVYDMGGGAARALGTVRGMVGADKNATQGVSVEVGERQAAVDLDLVVEYGTAIPDLAAAVRTNVISAIERMCGLEVTEVNIKIDDVHLPGQPKSDDTRQQEPRVQ
ncbi:Asp23/Gls24 family envelope stress response protein [Nonomuraea sp. NBC_01738]|uniref:Asp23/Gls24 family envelope stress response protein n=1 Tax=Nonomuraea sp. NBC_01738 TaxID=2976003 RepID=UPI002E12505A|nr:Asp23/Gls24 family envelope stress response protein [Nonomuraea sp. NBC_01738]